MPSNLPTLCCYAAPLLYRVQFQIGSITPCPTSGSAYSMVYVQPGIETDREVFK